MKNSNEYINEKVYNTNLKYSRLQNKTEELFFQCLDEGRDTEYFEKQLKKIWGNLNHKFLQDEIEEYATLIHEQNMYGKKYVEVEEVGDKGEVIFALIPLIEITKQELRFANTKIREYKRSYNSPAYKEDKKNYLKLKVQRYNNQTVVYKGGRKVQLSTYASMIHNTNLTRQAWNTTLDDADKLKESLFYIPYHPFSCPHCLEWQNKVMTRAEINVLVESTNNVFNIQEDILHPNCKCTIQMLNSNTDLRTPGYTPNELEDQYEIRQKTNSLTLKKEKILTDMKIQRKLGNEEEVDKLNAKRNKINSQIRELKGELPTKELQEELTISRFY